MVQVLAQGSVVFHKRNSLERISGVAIGFECREARHLADVCDEGAAFRRRVSRQPRQQGVVSFGAAGSSIREQEGSEQS